MSATKTFDTFDAAMNYVTGRLSGDETIDQAIIHAPLTLGAARLKPEGKTIFVECREMRDGAWNLVPRHAAS